MNLVPGTGARQSLRSRVAYIDRAVIVGREKYIICGRSRIDLSPSFARNRGTRHGDRRRLHGQKRANVNRRVVLAHGLRNRNRDKAAATSWISMLRPLEPEDSRYSRKIDSRAAREIENSLRSSHTLSLSFHFHPVSVGVNLRLTRSKRPTVDWPVVYKTALLCLGPLPFRNHGRDITPRAILSLLGATLTGRSDGGRGS